MQIDGKNINRNVFSFAEDVVFTFDNISGFNEEDGRNYPEISMIVVKKNNEIVFSEPNLLNLTEGTTFSPLQLKANFTANFPYKNNEEYEIKLTIWDTKGEGKFTYTMPFTIKENDLLKVESTTISYTSMYLWNESDTKVVTDTKINKEKEYLLILEGVHGLKNRG